MRQLRACQAEEEVFPRSRRREAPRGALDCDLGLPTPSKGSGALSQLLHAELESGPGLPYAVRFPRGPRHRSQAWAGFLLSGAQSCSQPTRTGAQLPTRGSRALRGHQGHQQGLSTLL